jgi:hypothetical protein
MRETEKNKKMAETHKLRMTQETFRRHEKEWEEFHRVEAATDSVRDFLESAASAGLPA